ncbi:hypothetical protein NO263_03640 [Gluconacetobacter entanii]|uniref:Core-binding (CB) domain-containing protein n=2 Tax=Gluconacetobacter entanii TaxID=108528 RepID=A0ABT3K2P2_9PROT|nr:hypothetical protein [Gluconacetobacter entanii]MCW4589668.1 hypothetical protein [Gluconacetobacter entanii]MCW4593549.1 hypothetical protein [Gluconacetobacter entanii]
MAVRRFSRETQRNYLRDVGRFATFLGRSPHTATVEDVRQFQIAQNAAGMPTPTRMPSCRRCGFSSPRRSTTPTLHASWSGYGAGAPRGVSG